MSKLVIVFLFFISFQIKSQEYQVLHVKGEILRLEDGSPLSTGDRITGKDQIRFASKDAMAAVLNSEKGRYVIKATHDKTEQSDLIYVLSSTLSPVRGGMSTRAAAVRNSIDFEQYFGETPYVWAGDQIRLDISTQAFIMDDQRFFFMRFVMNNEEVNKKLDFDEEVLILDKNTLFKVDDISVDPERISDYRLFYYDSTSEESTLLTPIQFVLINQQTLQELHGQYQDSSQNAYRDIAEILATLYGRCDPLQIEHNLSN